VSLLPNGPATYAAPVNINRRDDAAEETASKKKPGCTAARLRQKLSWRKKETDEVIDDLVSSGMVYGDYLSPWVTSHHKGSSVAGMPYLLKVSPWGDEFLNHWEELDKLSTATDHHYSELEYDLE
jgi:hypothetical protein